MAVNKNIFDVTDGLIFSKEVILPISKLKVLIEPLKVQDAIGFSLSNNLKELKDGKSLNKDRFEKLYKEFEGIINNTIKKVTDIEHEKINQLCFVDFLYLISNIRNVSEGEDDLILRLKCQHIIDKEKENKCDDIISFLINIEEFKLTDNSKEDIKLNAGNGTFIFKLSPISAHSFLKILIASENLKNSKEDIGFFDFLLEELFKWITDINIESNEVLYKYKTIKEEKEKIQINEINFDSFKKLIEKLPSNIIKNLFKLVLENQPKISNTVEVECSFGHKTKLEITGYHFFGLI